MMYTVLLVVLAYHSDSVQHAKYKLHLHHVKLRQLRGFFLSLPVPLLCFKEMQLFVTVHCIVILFLPFWMLFYLKN